MKSRAELLRESACQPQGLAEYAFQLQEQLRARDQALSEKEQLLAEARAYITELKQQLFGPKADKLTPEQETQLQQLAADAQEQAQRPPPLSQGGARTGVAGPGQRKAQAPAPPAAHPGDTGEPAPRAGAGG